MPRARYAPERLSIELDQPPKVTRLRSTPRVRDEGSVSIPSSQVLSSQMAGTTSQTSLDRTVYGRSLNLDRIEQALRSANYGSMTQLTDLSRETIDTDPHLAAVLNKRFGAVSALPWEMVPASGLGIDKERARFYADVCKDQLKQLPSFSQRIYQTALGLFDGRAALENLWLMVSQASGVPTVVHPTYGTVTWMIRDLEWVHPRRLQFGPERELRLCDRSPGNFSACGIALNDYPMKFVQFAPQLFGDYQEREGLARRCLYWSFFKRSSARERMQLMELFGKPWRWLEVGEDSTADVDDLNSADEQLQQLGGLASFRFPRGTKLNVEQPAKGAGEVHQTIIEESDKQLSKLVLGQTGTTDANPAGLNNVQANVMQDEQFMILLRDARLVSEAFETHLTDPIIELNFGAEALTHAPHFVLRADVPLDRAKEIARLDAALRAGLEVPLAEAYDVSGFRPPKEDEAVLKLDTPPLHPLAVQPPPERPVAHYPEGFDLPERTQHPIAPSAEGGLESPEAAEQQTDPTATDTATEPSAPKPGEPKVPDGIAINPSDVAKVVTVNEARKSQGLGPLMRADGTPDPDGELTVAEFAAKRAALAVAEGKVVEEIGKADIAPPAAPAAPVAPAPGEDATTPALAKTAGQPSTVTLPFAGFDDFDDCVSSLMADGHDEESARSICGALKRDVEGESNTGVTGPLVGAALKRAHPSDAAIMRMVYALEAGIHAANCVCGCSIQLEADDEPLPGEELDEEVRKAPQPVDRDELGSVETVITRGVAAGARASTAMTKTFVQAVQGKTTARAINEALDRAAEEQNLHPFSRSMERALSMSAMTGGLSSYYETTTDKELPALDLAAPRSFTERPFDEAVRWFKSLNVLPRTAFDQLDAAVKRRAFTVAGIHNQRQLEIAKRELLRQLQSGGSLADFATRLTDRFDAAGMTAINPSHVENVYRTNTVNAYNSGRHTQMTQPAVLRTHGYWQIRTVNDGPPRQRATHQAVNGWVLKADDPIWARVYAPFGWNCRCRVGAVSNVEVKRGGLRVRSGSEIQNLPDPGFTSGTPSLL